MAGILRFGIKNVIFGGFIYYTRTSGVWNDSETTYKLAQESIAFTKTFLKPVVNRIEDELPLQIRELPSRDYISRTLIMYWNKGVITSIKFISDLPSITVCYISKGISYVSKEVQKVITENDMKKNNHNS